jgi:hypothetical protein
MDLHYSGENSRAFWREINRTKDRTLYDFAVSLQEIESRVFAVVITSKPRKPTRRRKSR